jgi:hypothetical protein
MVTSEFWLVDVTLLSLLWDDRGSCGSEDGIQRRRRCARNRLREIVVAHGEQAESSLLRIHVHRPETKVRLLTSHAFNKHKQPFAHNFTT